MMMIGDASPYRCVKVVTFCLESIWIQDIFGAKTPPLCRNYQLDSFMTSDNSEKKGRTMKHGNCPCKGILVCGMRTSFVVLLLFTDRKFILLFPLVN